jgi:hypothetical protein
MRKRRRLRPLAYGALSLTPTIVYPLGYQFGIGTDYNKFRTVGPWSGSPSVFRPGSARISVHPEGGQSRAARP